MKDWSWLTTFTNLQSQNSEGDISRKTVTAQVWICRQNNNDKESYNRSQEDFDNDKDKYNDKYKYKYNICQEDFDRLLIAIGLPPEKQPELEQEEEEIKIIGKIHEMLWNRGDRSKDEVENRTDHRYWLSQSLMD